MDNKKLGLLVPPGNTQMEVDFHRYLPDTVDLHVGRLYISEEAYSRPEEHSPQMTDNVAEPARLLSKAHPDVMVFGCTGASFLHGVGWDREVVRRIEDAAGGIPAVAAAQAIVEALRELDIRQVAVGTPYREDSNRRLRKFLADSGFTVTRFEGRVRKDPGEIYKMGLRIDRPDADGLLVSCTAIKAWDEVERLEGRLGKPVVTSNQASMWLALRRMEVEDQVLDGGRLFRNVQVPVH